MHNERIYNFCTIIFLIIGISYIFIPIYRILCTTNITTDINISNILFIDFIGIKIQKLYTTLSNIFVEDIISNVISDLLWIRCSFLTKTNCAIQIIPLNQELILRINEPVLCIYKVINNTDLCYNFNTHFYVFPPTLEQLFVKIECFCFEEQLINGFETIELPLFFYVEDNINTYNLLLSKHMIIHCNLYNI